MIDEQQAGGACGDFLLKNIFFFCPHLAQNSRAHGAAASFVKQKGGLEG